MKIALGSDLSGVEYKNKLISKLKSEGYECLNMGSDSSDPVDYPVYAHKVCKCIQKKEADFGILICGSGIGMSIAANKHKGIRAGLCCNVKAAELTRMHNDSNVLCMGAKFISFEECIEISKTFLKNNFIGAHHTARVQMLDSYLSSDSITEII